MDILTHTLSGIAVGTVLSSFEESKIKDKFKIMTLCAFAGALPDIDVISLWSKFDSTIGSFFNLSLSGKQIYFSKLWYSHHAFMHSAIAGLSFTGLIGFIKYFSNIKSSSFSHSLNKSKFLMLGFFFAFLMHLFEDMPTPASTWGGVNLFFPSKTYIGGSGDIWWWNNYDIFLLVFCIVVLNLVFILFRQFIYFNLKKFTITTFIIGFSLVFVQVKTRQFDFKYSGYTNKYQEFEKKSKQIQKEILGDKIYNLMEKFDNKLKIYF